MINTLQSTQGGILYFPPGIYYIDRAASPVGPTGGDRYQADLYVPDNVVLQFAPGAMLWPAMSTIRRATQLARLGTDIDPQFANAVRIVIDGMIDAGLYQIFVPPNFPPPRGGAPVQAGEVVLTSTRIAEVYPEWWGAQPAAPSAVASFDSTAALRATVRAAYVVRTQPGLAFPTLPIVVSSLYGVRGPLTFQPIAPHIDLRDPTEFVTGPAPTQASTQGFVLRGGMPGANAGLVASGWDGSEAMVHIQGPDKFLIENLQFDANNIATRCMLLDGPSHLSGFRRCTFINPVSACVYVGQIVDLQPAEPVRSDGTLDFSGLNFDGCAFQLLLSVDHTGRTADSFPIAVILRGSESYGIVFSGCDFSGDARANILTYGGTFLLDACTFQNVLRVAGSPSGRGLTLNDGGIDVFLARPPPPALPPAAGLPAADGRLRRPPVRVAEPPVSRHVLCGRGTAWDGVLPGR